MATLLSELPNIGYIVSDLVRRGTPEQGKPLATKGSTELLINTDNKTIGVRDNTPENAVNAFRELQEFYLTSLDPSPLQVQYVEFEGTGLVNPKRIR